jgi:lactoylglutathione lyase
MSTAIGTGPTVERVPVRRGRSPIVRTLHVGLRVADLERSLAFYTAVGYELVGSVPETPIGHLTMLKLPDDEFVTIELVHDPTRGTADPGTGLSHLVVKVESMDATVAALDARGVEVETPTSPDGSDDFRTTMITDPDGNRIELVQWPAGHPDGMTAADLQD